MLGQEYDAKVDLWSVGVILYGKTLYTAINISNLRVFPAHINQLLIVPLQQVIGYKCAIQKPITTIIGIENYITGPLLVNYSAHVQLRHIPGVCYHHSDQCMACSNVGPVVIEKFFAMYCQVATICPVLQNRLQLVSTIQRVSLLERCICRGVPLVESNLRVLASKVLFNSMHTFTLCYVALLVCTACTHT